MNNLNKNKNKNCLIIGIILRWGFLIWELINFFYLLRTFLSSSGPVAQQIEALSLYSSRWALSEDSSFKSYPSRPEVYLVKNTWCDRQQQWKAVIAGDTVTRLSIPIWGRDKITRRPEVKFGRNVVKKETTQKLPRWRQKVRNKKKKKCLN